jgi:energy-coupling factor transporter ATP-binding protein EcfA2
MQGLNREEKVTFVIVTHDLDIAAQTQRVIRLKDGKVISDERTGWQGGPAWSVDKSGMGSAGHL